MFLKLWFIYLPQDIVVLIRNLVSATSPAALFFGVPVHDHVTSSGPWSRARRFRFYPTETPTAAESLELLYPFCCLWFCFVVKNIIYIHAYRHTHTHTHFSWRSLWICKLAFYSFVCHHLKADIHSTLSRWRLVNFYHFCIFLNKATSLARTRRRQVCLISSTTWGKS